MLQYPSAASFEVALPYCSNDHTMIATLITADEKWYFWYRENGVGEEAWIQPNLAQAAYANRW